MVTELDKTRAAILERYGTIHAFCREHSELSRTMVYSILRGTYPGDIIKQLHRITAALEGGQSDQAGLPPLEEIEAAIRNAACEKCRVKNTDLCRLCGSLHHDQAQAALAVFERHSRGG